MPQPTTRTVPRQALAGTDCRLRSRARVWGSKVSASHPNGRACRRNYLPAARCPVFRASCESTSGEYWEIQGGACLKGRVSIGGSKNAALVLMAASLLTNEPVRLQNVPDLRDIRSMAAVLESLGASVHRELGVMDIDAGRLTSCRPSPDAVGALRAGFLVLGPLLARCQEAQVSLPGGCKIGARPVDMHIQGLEALGAKISVSDDLLCVSGRLQGADIHLKSRSVGATETILMAVTLALGSTTIRNVAMEPEIVDLADLLNAMGAKICGAGEDVIRVEGVQKLHGASHTVIPDRIEAGTFAVAAAALLGSEVVLSPIVPGHMAAAAEVLQRMGCDIGLRAGESVMTVTSKGRLLASDIVTATFPGFPTDLQPQMTTALAVAKGRAIVSETVFEGRMRHSEELKKLGADIHQLDNCTLRVTGRPKLRGATANAHDLRGGAALVLAGLVAEGTTRVVDPWHVERGYEGFDKKLNEIGASVSRQ